MLNKFYRLKKVRCEGVYNFWKYKELGNIFEKGEFGKGVKMMVYIIEGIVRG